MNIIRICSKKIIVLSFIAFLFASCDKREEEQGMPLKLSIAQKIASTNEFSLINEAVVKAGLKSLLDSPGTFTFFAPSNDAMYASGLTIAHLNNMSSEQLQKLVKYQILPSRLFLEDFKLGVYYNELSLGGDSSFVIKNEKGLFVNGIKVTQTDLLQSNGIIHVIDKMLLPAQGDLLEVLAMDTSLSMFNTAMLRTAQGGTNLTNALVCGCKFTLFAPTNNAFKLAGYANIESIENMDYNKMVALLSYHITKERVFSSDWSRDMKVHMINNRYINILQDGSNFMIKGELNNSPINIIKYNTMATHGVVHSIERILQ